MNECKEAAAGPSDLRLHPDVPGVILPDVILLTFQMLHEVSLNLTAATPCSLSHQVHSRSPTTGWMSRMKLSSPFN